MEFKNLEWGVNYGGRRRKLKQFFGLLKFMRLKRIYYFEGKKL